MGGPTRQAAPNSSRDARAAARISAGSPHGDPACARVTRPFPTSVLRASPQGHSHGGDTGWRRSPISPPLLLCPSRAKYSKRQIISPAACSALPVGPALLPCLRPPRGAAARASRRQRGSAAKQTRATSGSPLGVTLRAGQDPAGSPVQHTGRRAGARDGPAPP